MGHARARARARVLLVLGTTGEAGSILSVPLLGAQPVHCARKMLPQISASWGGAATAGGRNRAEKGSKIPRARASGTRRFWGSLKVSTSSSPVRDQVMLTRTDPLYLTAIMGVSQFES